MLSQAIHGAAIKFLTSYIEQHFAVVLFIVLHEVVLTFESVDKIFKPSLTMQVAYIEQYFSVEPFV